MATEKKPERFFCIFSAHKLSQVVYKDGNQNTVVPAQYWHDPMAPKTYASQSQFLADINMEGPSPNLTYAKNLGRLNKFVMAIYEDVSLLLSDDILSWPFSNLPTIFKEEIVEPKESGHFKFYKDWSSTEIVDFDDWSVSTGLKNTLLEMRQKGRIDYLSVPNSRHMDHDRY